MWLITANLKNKNCEEFLGLVFTTWHSSTQTQSLTREVHNWVTGTEDMLSPRLESDTYKVKGGPSAHLIRNNTLQCGCRKSKYILNLFSISLLTLMHSYITRSLMSNCYYSHNFWLCWDTHSIKNWNRINMRREASLSASCITEYNIQFHS